MRQVFTACCLTVDDAQDGVDLGALFAQCLSGLDDLPAGGDDVLHDRDALACDLAALGESARSVGLGLLPHEPCW